MTKPKVQWRERLDELRAIVAAGGGYRQIAEHFGCSYDCAHWACKKYGVELDKAEIARRRSEIAKRLNTDPVILANRKRAAKAMYRDPALREKRRQNANERWADPEQRDVMVSAMRRVFIDNPETRRIRSENATRQWQRVRERKAREAEEAARLATMTPFERQLWLVETGRARITERPVLRAAEYHRTMGGVVGDYSI